MKLTFGIISSDCDNNLISTIDSILHEIPSDNCEIIVVADKEKIGILSELPVHTIGFDENIRKNWITQKKNIISHIAKYSTIVYMHDYIKLCKGWYNGLLKYDIRVDNEWDVLMNRIEDIRGNRYRDWVAWDDPNLNNNKWLCKENWCGDNGIEFSSSPNLVPYVYKKTEYMYVSGAYFIAKKKFMIDNPFDISLSWGQGEDVEWSMRVRNKWKYKFNPYSRVQLLKEKFQGLPEIMEL